VLIGVLRSADGQAGRKITYGAGAFTLEGRVATSLNDVIAYDRQGQLEWVNEGTRAWVLSLAASTASAPAQAAAQAADPTSQSRKPRIRWAVVVPLAIAVAVVAVVLTVALPRLTAHPREESWPAVFEGTWEYTHSDPTEDPSFSEGRLVVFSRDSDSATIGFGSTSAAGGARFTFRDDTLTVSGSGWLDGTYRRSTSDGADFLGRYKTTRTGDLAKYDLGYGLEFDGVTLTLTIYDQGNEPEWMKFKLSEDGKTMNEQSGGDGSIDNDFYKKVG
jgi:hypothetical protein